MNKNGGKTEGELIRLKLGSEIVADNARPLWQETMQSLMHSPAMDKIPPPALSTSYVHLEKISLGIN